MKRRDVKAGVSVAVALQFRVDVDGTVCQQIVDDGSVAVCARESERIDNLFARRASDELLDIVHTSQTRRAFEIERRAAARQILRCLRLAVRQTTSYE